MKRSTKQIAALVVAIFLTYVASYLYWTRAASTPAEHNAGRVFFYHPETTEDWPDKEAAIRHFYFPLILVEVCLRTSMRAELEPISGFD